VEVNGIQCLMRESEGNKKRVEDLRVNGCIILKCFFKNCTDLHWTDLAQKRTSGVTGNTLVILLGL